MEGDDRIAEVKKREINNFFPLLSMIGLFVLIHGLALFTMRSFEAADMVAFSNPNDPMNLVFFFSILLSFTVAILLIAKFQRKKLIQYIFLGAVGYTTFFVVYSLFCSVIPEAWSLLLSTVSTAVLVVMLIKRPEWYVVDLSGVVLGVGAIGMMGISLSILLVIALLVGLAIYDAIAVYKTEHMIDIADVVLDLRLPVVLVIPKMRSYSLIKETMNLKEKIKTDEERDAYCLGLGDVIMPGILVAATFHNITTYNLLIALSVMLGTLVGFVVLTRFLAKGKPQAGLPFLCSGAILGYLVSSFLIFGRLAGLT